TLVARPCNRLRGRIHRGCPAATLVKRRVVGSVFSDLEHGWPRVIFPEATDVSFALGLGGMRRAGTTTGPGIAMPPVCWILYGLLARRASLVRAFAFFMGSTVTL